ncbi:glycosyltransferase family 2 protein [Stakelama saccharophila]|uniref:Glycosyltransferase family A protein n=1 Tax=Stakelama saccharophila TaxID=3075605 RepID=A0ABZ0BAR9_9SPHN|nr:glycosyltransferase family A protein [Stakelama sp. W311]WNO54515.1 glycosyltransferase family A protein [Stakelama sp. W311]
MKEPAFSVVVPLYNKGPHVLATLTSILAQSCPPAEVIVVDDGSTDGGDERVAAIDHPAVRLLRRSPPGPGGYAARNLAIEAATSDWIAFCDADDLWAPDHLKSIQATIGAFDGRIGCVFARTEIVEAQGRRPYRMDETLIPARTPLTRSDIVRAWIRTERCPLWTGATAMRRDLAIEAGLFPAGRARRGGDKDLWLRAVWRTRSAYTGRTTAEFHQNTVNRVTTSTAHVALPVILETIGGLMADANADERALLRRLGNLELLLYARHAAGKGQVVGGDFLRRLHYPEGVPVAARIAAFKVLAPAMRAIRRSR